MIKATTQHGTYYLIDLNEGKAMRVKGDGRNDMYRDGEWFQFSWLDAIDFDEGKHMNTHQIEIGKGIYFNVINHSHYDWRSTTRVVSIEEYDDSNSSS